MKCLLCGQYKELRDSHIIPEFFYTPIYDDKHRMKKVYTNNIENTKYIQKGEREKMFCDRCELKFSKYERYASQILFHNEELKFTKCDGEGVELVVDYKLFKLFEMSILWRLGNNQKFSPDCRFNSKNRRRLKKMLLEDNPGETYEYGCIMIRNFQMQDISNGTIMTMGMFNIQGCEYYAALMAPYYWFFKISKDRKQEERQEYFYLQKDGYLRILLDYHALGKYWNNLFQKWSKNNSGAKNG